MKNTDLLKEKDLVDHHLNQGPRPLSSFSFVSIFAWGDFFDFEMKIIKDHLCIFAKTEGGVFLYLPPLGPGFDAATLKECFEHMAQGQRPKAINRIENIPGNLLSAFQDLKYNQYAKPAEYLYHKANLVELKGNAYKSKRHDCNHFSLHQPNHSFEPFQESDLNACLELYERWAKQRAATHSENIYRSMLEENRLVHERLLSFARALGLVVRVLKVKDQIIGYTFGFPLDEVTFCVYAEIVDLNMTGAAATCFKSFCADRALQKFSQINTMDDFAMPQVARAKQAYHPCEKIISYTISLKTGQF